MATYEQIRERLERWRNRKGAVQAVKPKRATTKKTTTKK
jgi:hypothetical protein